MPPPLLLDLGDLGDHGVRHRERLGAARRDPHQPSARVGRVGNPQAPPLSTMLVELVRARGSFDRLNHDLAVCHADQPAGVIVDELRRLAGSRELPVVTNHRTIVMDLLVHGQDIAVPLGIEREMPRAAAGAAADRLWEMGWPFWARRRLRGMRLVASTRRGRSGPEPR